MKFPKPTRVVPKGIVITFSLALAFTIIYSAFLSILYSGTTYANVPEELETENERLISYLKSPPFMPNTLDYLNENERSHMTDVKRLFDIGFILFLFSCGILVGITAAFMKQKRSRLQELLTRSFWGVGWSLLLGCFLLGMASLLSFGKTFVIFHAIFFPQGNWMFPWESVFMQMYPIEFFRNFTLRWMMNVLFAGILSVCLGLFIDRMQHAEHTFKRKTKKGKRKKRTGQRKKKS